MHIPEIARDKSPGTALFIIPLSTKKREKRFYCDFSAFSAKKMHFCAFLCTFNLHFGWFLGIITSC